MSKSSAGHVLIGVRVFGYKYKYICLVAGRPAGWLGASVSDALSEVRGAPWLPASVT